MWRPGLIMTDVGEKEKLFQQSGNMAISFGGRMYDTEGGNMVYIGWLLWILLKHREMANGNRDTSPSITNHPLSLFIRDLSNLQHKYVHCFCLMLFLSHTPCRHNNTYRHKHTSSDTQISCKD
ncbi:hypothetical protein RJ641_034107 [Dillenia turbinata]|uniref:Uncharacterized protein n=1 Tax=Dillenia turbinata TaxID=194707 RepID=A0AAN8W128_9MAGN